MPGITGDQSADRAIAIRIEGGDQQDPEALLAWLRREPRLSEALARQELRIEPVTTRDDRDGTASGDRPPTMDGGVGGVLLVVLGAAMGPLFEDLYETTKRAVRAWVTNRRELGGPPVTAEPRVVPAPGADTDTADTTDTRTDTTTDPDSDADSDADTDDDPPGQDGTSPAADGDQG